MALPPKSDTPDTPRVGERIAKLLARAGVASRREVERMIAEGRVKIGEEVVTTPATVLPNLAGVSVDGVAVKAAEAVRLFGFHKPAGLITAERDPAGRPTIYSALRNALPPGTPRLMPVGRLDLSTEGLLLLTNDGELKRAMELPSSGVPRTYRARTYGTISQARLEDLMDGTEIEGVRYGPINANMERKTGRNQWIELTLTEGKNREVRRVLEHLGLEVSRLLRVSYGPFLLGELPRGAAVEIAPAHVERFAAGLDMAPEAVGMPKKPEPKVAPAARPASKLVIAGAPKPDNRTWKFGKPRKPDPSRPVDRDAPRSAPRGGGDGGALERAPRRGAGRGRDGAAPARDDRAPSRGPSGGRGSPPRGPSGGRGRKSPPK